MTDRLGFAHLGQRCGLRARQSAKSLSGRNLRHVERTDGRCAAPGRTAFENRRLLKYEPLSCFTRHDARYSEVSTPRSSLSFFSSPLAPPPCSSQPPPPTWLSTSSGFTDSRFGFMFGCLTASHLVPTSSD